MSDWPVYASWNGPIVMIGFGSIARGVLPLILRHIQCSREQITVIDPNPVHRDTITEQGLKYIPEAVTKKNYKSLLTPLLTQGPGQALIINLSVDVGSADIVKLAHTTDALYLDTVNEPWLGVYDNPKLGNAGRSNYKFREDMLALKKSFALKAKGGDLGPTAVSCCGANPGMVSWLVKQALLNLAEDLKLKVQVPETREGWAKLMQKLGVKGIHIAERDTQRSKNPKPLGTFINSWSVEGFISEGLQPAELGWGSHEKKLPPEGRRFNFGCKASIYLERPGADTRVRSWVPGVGPHFALLITHNEAISIADYFTVKKGAKVTYRPTCHYAYHPCNDALLSVHEMLGAAGKKPDKLHILEADEILDGADELGVLLYGIKKNAYWYGSRLTIEEARRLAPDQNATGLQVTSSVLAGLIWAIENPRAGIVETEEMDFKRCLEIQTPYLGKIFGTYTDWTPLEGRSPLFAEKLDKRDPWQFSNIIAR